MIPILTYTRVADAYISWLRRVTEKGKAAWINADLPRTAFQSNQ
jgi:hypothetical protein